MKKLLIHIGTCKRGSTSIQKRLSDASKALIATGNTYPKVYGRIHHQLIVASYIPSERLPRGLRRQFSLASIPKMEEMISKYKKK
jgi:hypothetical protein